MTPTIAGQYTMTVKIKNFYTDSDSSLSTEIAGSPFTVTVYPGLVDPTKCYSDVPSSSIPE